MNDNLQHFGVKGMKWGIRKRIRDEIGSIKREASWKKDFAVNKMATKTEGELKTALERVRSENTLKALGKHKEYITRGELSDSDLKARVSRLQIESQLQQQIKLANKAQIDAGRKIANVVIKTALSGKKDFKGAATTLVKESFNDALNKEIKKKTGLNLG